VEDEAGGRGGAIGSLGAGVCVEGDVAFARGDYWKAARIKQGSQADAEGEGDGLFRDGCADLAAVIVAAMRCIQQDYETRLRTRNRCGRSRRRRCSECGWRRGSLSVDKRRRGNERRGKEPDCR